MTSIYERSFEMALAAFPKSFRESFGDEMLLVFKERVAERSVFRRGVFVGVEVADALIAGARMRLENIVVMQRTAAAYVVVAMLASTLALHNAEPTAVSRIDFRGHDPAGKFTITVINGRAISATLDGNVVPRVRIAQKSDSIRILADNGDVALAVRFDRERREIGWTPRK